MTREEAKELFRSNKDAYGKPKHIMKNIDKIYDDVEKEEPIIRHHPHICPVCNGRGFVMAGFYSSFTGEFTTSAIEQETCRTCNGSGIIWD